MKFQSRSAWGAQPPRWNPGPVNRSQGVFIHYNGPAVSNAVLAGDYNSVRSFLQGIQRFHQNTQGWPDIAYSWCVDSVGRIWELRGWGVAGAHTLNWNWNSHAIFLPLGGNQGPTREQINGCRTVIAEHNRRYGAGFVRGHQDAPNSTSCPGPAVLPLVRRGEFNPRGNEVQPAPPVPSPTPAVTPSLQGEDNMMPPIMLEDPTRVEIFYRFKESIIHEHPNGSLWLLYPNTPYRVEVRKEDVDTLRFMGAKYQKVNQETANWFWSYNVREAPPRLHVKTPDDVRRFQFFGVELKKVTRQQAEFFRRYSRLVEGLKR